MANKTKKSTSSAAGVSAKVSAKASSVKTVEPAAEPKKSQLEKSLVRTIKKKNAVIGKGPKTLGSTRGAEQKKIKALNKKKVASAKKKGERKPPTAGSLPFLTYKHAVDTALFFCPGKYLNKQEVCEFINKTFRNTGHDETEASQKQLQKCVDKVLKKGVQPDGDHPARYNPIVTPSEDSVLRNVYKYKLDPKLRAKKTAEFNFQPVFPKNFDTVLVKEIQSKKSFVVPAFHKRASSKKKTQEIQVTASA